MMTIVIFGGTGDLAKNKLFKALFHLQNQGLLKDDTRILGFSRKEIGNSQYREMVSQYIGNEVADDFLDKVSYFQGDLKDVESYKKLENHLKELDDQRGICSNKIFYLAVSPALYEESFRNLHSSRLSEVCSGADKWTRILVEKPFGTDVESAQDLEKLLSKLFKDDQVYRIDHYLGKVAIQNIITFRFANSIFEPIWTNKYIEGVKIELFEIGGVEGRGIFYDKVGALRDVGQNHILQMLALVAMENPESMEAANIRGKIFNVLKDVELLKGPLEENILRAQYSDYTEADGVEEDSETETFFRVRFGIDNKRWKGVPFTVESGKGLDQNLTRITINFKQVDTHICKGEEHRNKIVFDIQPENKITVRFWARRPGLQNELINEDLSFNYSSRDERAGDAYEQVLYDAIKGDQTLFTSADEVDVQWKIVCDIEDKWADLPLVKYEKGSKVGDIV